jgi:hypothetical protein
MKAFAQFMLSIGSISSLDTSALTQILLLGNTDDDDEDFEPEAAELEQKLNLQLRQKTPEASQCFEDRAGTWTVAAELENEDGSFIYQFVLL